MGCVRIMHLEAGNVPAVAQCACSCYTHTPSVLVVQHQKFTKSSWEVLHAMCSSPTPPKAEIDIPLYHFVQAFTGDSMQSLFDSLQDAQDQDDELQSPI